MLDAALYGADTPYGHPARGHARGVQGPRARRRPGLLQGALEPGRDDARRRRRLRHARRCEAKLDAGLGAWKPAGAKKPAQPVAKPAKLDQAPAARRSQGRRAVRRAHRPRRSRPQGQALLRSSRCCAPRSAAASRAGSSSGCASSSASRTARAPAMDYRLRAGPFVISTAIVTPDDRHGPRRDREDPRRPRDHRRAGRGAREVQAEPDPRAAGAVRDQRVDRRRRSRELALYGLPDNWYASYADEHPQGHREGRQGGSRSVDPAKKHGDLDRRRHGQDPRGLDKLGFGDAAMHDLYGMPLAK